MNSVTQILTFLLRVPDESDEIEAAKGIQLGPESLASAMLDVPGGIEFLEVGSSQSLNPPYCLALTVATQAWAAP